MVDHFPFPPFSRPPVGWVSAPVLPSCWGADQLAEVELPTAPSALFFPVAIVRDDLATLETAADRHERLAAAAKAAPRGERLRLQHMTRAACLERLRAELDVMQ